MAITGGIMRSFVEEAGATGTISRNLEVGAGVSVKACTIMGDSNVEMASTGGINMTVLRAVSCVVVAMMVKVRDSDTRRSMVALMIPVSTVGRAKMVVTISSRQYCSVNAAGQM